MATVQNMPAGPQSAGVGEGKPGARGLASPDPRAWQGRRAALFLPSVAGGGAERLFVNLASCLVGMGIAVDLVLSRARGPFLDIVPSTVRVVDLGARKTTTSLPELLGYLRREHPDMVLAALHAAVVALAAKRFFLPGLRVVVHYASTFSEEFRHVSLAGRMMMRAFLRLLPAADAVHLCSKGAQEDLARHAPESRSKMHVIWPVVKVAGAMDGPPPHPWFRTPGPPVLVSVGRLDAGKDFETLIRAFAEVRRHRPSRLLVLGEGPRRGALEALVGELGLADSVHLPGFQSNPGAYVARAQVFALASRFESFALVLVEALACGTPVVSTDCPNGPSEILGQGKWGRLVPVGDWRAMAEAVLATLERPPDPGVLRQRARAFSEEGLVQRHARLMFGDR